MAEGRGVNPAEALVTCSRQTPPAVANISTGGLTISLLIDMLREKGSSRIEFGGVAGNVSAPFVVGVLDTCEAKTMIIC